MITSLLFQNDAGSPAVLCKANTRTEAKHAAACHAARVAFLRSLYGHQPAKGLIHGHIHQIETDGTIVVVEIGFHEYGYCRGMFELPIHVFKFQGQSVSSSMDVANWVHHNVVLQVLNRFKFDGIFLSNVAAISIANSGAPTEPPYELPAKVEA